MNQHIKDSLDAYVSHGQPLGHFLTAVLSNDLMDAFGRADEENARDMHEIVRYVYNEMPANCHGSRAIVAEWIERHRIARAEKEE